MKKIQLIKLVQHRLSGGNCPPALKGKYHPEIIAKHIQLAMNYLIKEITYLEAERNSDFTLLDDYIKTFTKIEVKEDSDREERFIDLPVRVVPLPKNRGIRFISDQKNQSVQYLYRENNSDDMYSDLDVDRISDRARYYKENDKIFFSRHLPSSIKHVLIKVIPDFESLDYEDELNVPSGFGKLIFDLVFQSMQGMPLTKKSNDGNPNTV